MKYTSPPLTFEEQADLLIKRGLYCQKPELVSILRSVSYYRLGEYCHYFQDKNGCFKENNSLKKIWRSYIFDRQLRLLIMDALERIEIALKTDISYVHAHKFGAFGYLDPRTLPNLTSEKHKDFVAKIKRETDRSKEPFVTEFFREYGDSHKYLPVFRVTEIMSFGSLLTFFRGLESKEKKKIAKRYFIMSPVLESWLLTLNYIRNICAHHGRLFNKVLAIKPFIPKKKHDPEWHTPFKIKNDRVYSVIMVLAYFVEIIAPKSRWNDRFQALLKKYNDIPVRVMGFPPNWKDHDVWKIG